MHKRHFKISAKSAQKHSANRKDNDWGICAKGCLPGRKGRKGRRRRQVKGGVVGGQVGGWAGGRRGATITAQAAGTVTHWQRTKTTAQEDLQAETHAYRPSVHICIQFTGHTHSLTRTHTHTHTHTHSNKCEPQRKVNETRQLPSRLPLCQVPVASLPVATEQENTEWNTFYLLISLAYLKNKYIYQVKSCV